MNLIDKISYKLWERPLSSATWELCYENYEKSI